MSTTPTNGKGPDACDAGPLETTTNAADFGMAGLSGQAHQVSYSEPNKAKATVFAKAALAGVSVYELADGSFLASRWGLVKPCADLAAVQHLVRQIGGAA